jgi:hypothetical protein
VINKKHNAIRLANSIDLSNVDNLIVTGGGVTTVDSNVLVATCETLNPEIKVNIDCHEFSNIVPMDIGRKPNHSSIIVTQKMSDFDILNKNAPYRHWIKKLSRKDTLPRGKFFKGKIGGGIPYVILDEAHRFMKGVN